MQSVRLDASGLTLFALIFRADTCYDVTTDDGSFTAYTTVRGADATTASHAVTVSALGDGSYSYTLPGNYTRQADDYLVFYDQAGGSPVVADLANARATAALDNLAELDAANLPADVDTLKNRIGSWTGTARNTILGWAQAMMRKDADATVPSDVNADLGGGVGTADNTTDSNQGIADNQIKKGTQYRYTNSDGDTKDVTVDDVP